MKNLILLLSIIGFALSNCEPVFAQTNPVPITFSWDCPTNDFSQDAAFIFIHTTNVSQPVSAWQYFTNVPATNLVWTTLVLPDSTNATFSVQFPVIPGQHFFKVGITNLWNDPVFSNTASTPPVAIPPANVRISR